MAPITSASTATSTTMISKLSISVTSLEKRL
jgi:hypothetical protein